MYFSQSCLDTFVERIVKQTATSIIFIWHFINSKQPVLRSNTKTNYRLLGLTTPTGMKEQTKVIK